MPLTSSSTQHGWFSLMSAMTLWEPNRPAVQGSSKRAISKTLNSALLGSVWGSRGKSFPLSKVFNSVSSLLYYSCDFDSSNFPASQFPFSFKSWTPLQIFFKESASWSPHDPIRVLPWHNLKLLCHPLPEILSPIPYTNLPFGFHSTTETTPGFSTGLGFIRKLETKSHASLFLRSFGREYSQGPHY